MYKEGKHRNWRKSVIVTGLLALAAPLMINLGQLGEAIHAEATTIINDPALVVKAEAGQDANTTTWTFDLTRPEATEQWATVDFDFEAAGLTEAIAKLGDEEVGITDNKATLTLQAAKETVVVTAQHEDNTGADLKLPVKFSLYNESTLINQVLAEENREASASLLFTTVSQSPLPEVEVTEPIVSSEDAVDSPIIAPMVGPSLTTGDGYLQDASGTKASPIATLNSLPKKTGDEVKTIKINKDQHTTALVGGSNAGKTSSNNFQIWSNKSSNTIPMVNYNSNVAGYNDGSQEKDVIIAKKYDQNKAKIDFGTNDPSWQTVLGNYHDQYQRANTNSNNNSSSYLIAFANGGSAINSSLKFDVVYDHVGWYVDENGITQAMGAVMEISNLKTVDGTAQQQGDIARNNRHFIDVPNNLYSGVLYRGFESLDIELHFYAVTTDASGNSTFTHKLEVTDKADDEDDVTLTFSSLNNFGKSNWNSTSFAWDEDDANINSAKFAESVSVVNPATSQERRDIAPITSTPTAMRQEISNSDSRQGLWYSTTHGRYSAGPDNHAALQWDDGYMHNGYWWVNNDAADRNYQHRWLDALGSNTFQYGALSYKIAGEASRFRLYTGTGNTWQTITAAKNVILDLPAPKKTVTKATGDGDSFLKQKEAKKAADVVAAGKATDQEKEDTPYTPTTNGTGLDAGANAWDVDLKSYIDPTGDDLQFNYWIFQPTYTANDSIGFPNQLVMTDLLPAGIDFISAVVYNEAGTAMTVNTHYTQTITNVGNRKEVKISLTNAGLKFLKWSGEEMAFKLKVKTLAEPTEGKTFVNTANVATIRGRNKDTNDVKNSIKPVNSELKIKKTDQDGTALTPLEAQDLNFKLFKVGSYNYVKNANPQTPQTQVKEMTRTAAVNNVTWTWNTNFKPGVYILQETSAPENFEIDGNGLYLLKYLWTSALGWHVEIQHSVGVVSATTLANLENGHTAFDFNAGFNWTAGTGGLTGDDVITAPNNGVKLSFDGKLANKKTVVEPKIKIIKQDQNGSALAGATFAYRAVQPTVSATWTDLVANGQTGQSVSSAALELNKVYELKEKVAPSGQTPMENKFFKILKTADVPAGIDVTNVTTNLVMLEMTPSISTPTTYTATGVIGTVDESGETPTGIFTFKNYEKSIFPETGSLGGIVAVAVVGIFLIAASIIKRRRD
ncbi:MAG: hypothetical protein LBT80_08515 [Lactobacillaceae bacterium]|jgi:hypothetical protein|nr:hypothetical protein [Lactobacillaceae bacterium]